MVPRLPRRPSDSHKGDFGRALLVGGSRGMIGAIALSGMATLRSGAGLVKLAVPDVCLDAVASMEPSYMTTGLPHDVEGRLTLEAREPLEPLIEASTCIGCGPGLARSDQLTELVGWIYESVSRPVVLDADALNALAAVPERLGRAAGPRILTPHPGEFARLIGGERLEGEQRAERAVRFAAEHGIVLVLKGHRTLVTDGTRQVRNTTGNPGMATGGTGDVLTGIITALVCQQLEPFEAAQLGVYAHGLAGDLAARQLGQISLIARDLVDHLPAALRSCEASA